jgi:hypothetical protein
MEIVGGEDAVSVGEVFSPNRTGYFSRAEHRTGRISVAAARRGKEWAADGRGQLLRLKVRLFRDGFPSSLHIEEGRLLSSSYTSVSARLADPVDLGLPREFALGQNFPNPFNPTTTIPFRVALLDALLAGRETPVSIEIYNAIGQKVRTLFEGEHEPGYYRAVWDGRDSEGKAAGSGMYIYQLQVGGRQQVKKMILVR